MCLNMLPKDDVLAFIIRFAMWFHVITAAPIAHFYSRSIIVIMLGDKG